MSNIKHGEPDGDINAPLKLPCGVVLQNRIVKAAMTEHMADSSNHATSRHHNLYRAWAQSGAGLLLTGNVLVDRRYLEDAGNVAIDGAQDAQALAALKKWAALGTENGTQLWMQINHAGRQSPAHINIETVGPSSISQPAYMGRAFGKTRGLTAEEIKSTIARYAYVASMARETGFTGVQIHGAHGYLVSSFLSPKSNQREDEWGGSLENRSRFALEIIRAIRAKVGDDFPLALKLNSSDFQKGGFTHEECLEVVGWLNNEKLDLLEISGGSYEARAWQGVALADPTVKQTTRAREGFFLDYARGVAKVAAMPLMVTGGFRDPQVMKQALRDGALDFIGLARPFCAGPDEIKALLLGSNKVLSAVERRLQSPLDDIWCMTQMLRMSEDKSFETEFDPEKAKDEVVGYIVGVRDRWQKPDGITASDVRTNL